MPHFNDSTSEAVTRGIFSIRGEIGSTSNKFFVEPSVVFDKDEDFLPTCGIGYRRLVGNWDFKVSLFPYAISKERTFYEGSKNEYTETKYDFWLVPGVSFSRSLW